jgi:hypothetical protein
MKKIQTGVISAILVFSMANCNGQTAPKEVLKTFNEKFTKASDVKWDQEESNEWEAEFMINGKEASASFDLAGMWLETEMEVTEKDIAPAAHQAINTKFADWKFEKAESIEKPNFNGYEIEMEKGETSVELVVTASGELTIEKVSVEDEGSDDKAGDDDEEDDDDGR